MYETLFPVNFRNSTGSIPLANLGKDEEQT